MRIKIDGPITPERLADALIEAAIEIGDETVTFYNANLYVVAYDSNGKAINTKDAKGSDLVIHMPLLPGALDKPSISAEERKARIETKRQSKESEVKASKEQERLAAEERAHQQESLRQWQEKVRTSLAAYEAREIQFRALITKIGAQEVIGDLNRIVDAVWESTPPRFPHGRSKGQLRPKPLFEITTAGLVLLFRSAERTSSIKIRSPMGGTTNDGEVVRFWQYEEWACAMQLFQQRFNELALQVRVPEILGQIQLRKNYWGGRTVEVWA